MSDSLKNRLDSVRRRIDEACRRAGRATDEVTLLPVSKTFPSEVLREAAGLGVRRFGESRMQEIRQKDADLADLHPQWVLIGHLQTNKAKDAARLVTEVQSLDRWSLAEALDTRLTAENRVIDVLVQVKTSPEPSKFGLDPDDLPDFLQRVSELSTLRVKGLMTMAVNSPDEEAVRACFRRLRMLRDQMVARGHTHLSRLSMGMSGDFEQAIEEGSTEVRIGSAIFGAR
ncbi:MAG TPA: YggS family pyridoxal phosphate-dependent enzyme [Pusillimonas sp.]|uniref:YggS family pyridoxal phosphate-dependent enzyme n=1 Tax=unclassified Pusillimonas TaxID=2640016 RepID=UPI0026125F3F|nr:MULTISPECIES: YggS family pyridoxal phosphate-dependent enzyme [unclassified Pusillimonas]HLU18879.1 YggS family pyridoxal phosphate-dependent enzyme [Pusillimonas sp.]